MSAFDVKQALGRQRCVSDKWIGPPLVAEGRHRPVSRHKGGVVAHRPQTRGDRADQLLLIAAREIPAADRALEQDVADQRELGWRMVEDDMAGGVAGTVANVEGEVADGRLVAVV